MKRLIVMVLLLVPLFPGTAAAWRGYVDAVLAGDILAVREEGGGGGAVVKLYGVDAPEISESGREGQPYGREAFELAQRLLPKDTLVIVHDMRQDTMGRDKGGIVTLPDGTTLQEALLKAGLAWVTPLHCGNCRDWKAAQEAARRAKRGLWQDAAPVPPWEWRVMNRP